MKTNNKEKSAKLEEIVVRGARTHNLKNITVSMPRNKMIAITGLSGSGKSSLAFDTIFAEGQRRYVESLSAYARQFLTQMQKPDVDEIEGLSPAISIDQKTRSGNPRSTVATITEISDYLRVLYARAGRAYCLDCGTRIERLSKEEILHTIKERIEKAAKKIKKKEVVGVPYTDVVVGIYAPIIRGRKGEYYQLLYDMLGRGYQKVLIDGVEKKLREQIVLEKNKKHDISFLVDEIAIDAFFGATKADAENRLMEAIERAVNDAEGVLAVSLPENYTVMSTRFSCANCGYSFPEVEPRLFSFNSPYGACPTCNGLGTKHFFGDEPCETCHGARLRKEALNVFLEDANGARRSVVDFSAQTIGEAKNFILEMQQSPREASISKVLLKEIETRLSFLLDVGLDYLSLDRRANTLSGGESQRIRLASQLGSRLVGALYVLDEPTIGLHQRDNERLIKTLSELRNLGNTIIIVEHDEDTMYASDYLIDIGPGAGVSGGEVVVAGEMSELLMAKKSPANSRTLSYLREEVMIPVPKERRTKDRGAIKIRGGNIFTIKNLSADLPLGKMVCVTGVSGSGKSSFLYEILYKNLQARLDRRYRSNKTFNCTSFSGAEYVSRAVLIDQSPIGRTPRSNPATYTGAFTFIRDLFASSEEARLRGWRANRFSFNVKGGRCETCQGNGEIAVEMHFLPTVYVPCDVCLGKRFMKETLEVNYKKKNIYDVLKMTVAEALEFFADIPAISDRLKTLNEVGLGYLQLGQSATTLSGGEAQRVKISSELYRPHVEKTIYLLDEPTVGLHYDDVAKLIQILNQLVEKGNTVVLIEHNMDVIKNADYLLDFGPEGGAGGGELVAFGAPEEVMREPKSHTGKYLKKVLKRWREYEARK